MSNLDQTISNPDAFSVDGEQLFAELTPKQASVIEGGKTLFIQSIEAVKAGADGFFQGGDDTFFKVNGRLGPSLGSMDSGQTKTVNRSFSFDGDARVELFDSDGGAFFGQDADSLGGFTATNPTNGIVSKRVSGSGSRYNVFYSVSPSAQIAPGTGVLFA